MLKVLDPITLTDAMVTSSSVPETDYAAWVSGTTYAANANVIRTQTHSIYKRILAGAGTTAPESDTANWVRTGPTNRWAMFDASVNTKTTGSNGTPSLLVTLNPGRCNGLSLLDTASITTAKITVSYPAVIGTTGTPTSATVTDYAYGITLTKTIVYGAVGSVTLVYDINLLNRNVSNWTEYFFEPYTPKTDVFIGFPSRTNHTITIEINSAYPKIGAVMVGNYIELGEPEYGINAGIEDYSSIITNQYGVTTLVPRDYVKNTNYSITVDNWAIRRTFSTLAGLRAKPAVFIGSEDYRYTPFTVFGYVSSFTLTLSFATFSVVNIEVKGLSLA